MKRKTVNLNTFKKVENFLKSLKEPVYKTFLERKLQIDYYSMNYILKNIDKELLKKIKEKKCIN